MPATHCRCDCPACVFGVSDYVGTTYGSADTALLEGLAFASDATFRAILRYREATDVGSHSYAYRLSEWALAKAQGAYLALLVRRGVIAANMILEPQYISSADQATWYLSRPLLSSNTEQPEWYAACRGWSRS